MKIAKRIDITYKEIVNRGDVSAILLVDSEKVHLVGFFKLKEAKTLSE